jgi:hypothetical protein
MIVDLTNEYTLPILFGFVSIVTSMVILLSTQPESVVYYDGNRRKKVSYVQVAITSSAMGVLIALLSAIVLRNKNIQCKLSKNY